MVQLDHLSAVPGQVPDGGVDLGKPTVLQLRHGI